MADTVSSRRPRLIYLHGFASSPGSFKAVQIRAALEERGVAVEVPDFNEGDFLGLTIGRQIRLLDRLTEGEPDRGVVLVGSSMGAYVAALFAARDPCVAAQVLMAPALDFGRRFVQGLGEEAAAAWKREGSLPVQHFGEGRMTRIGWGLVEDALRHPPFPEVRVPTVIIHGRRDEVVPCTLSEELAANNPGVELVLVDSDHGLADAVPVVVERIRRVLSALGQDLVS